MSDVKVCVSGVTGFIGAHIARDLMEKGYTVHGTVRNNIPERVAHLTKLSLPGTIRIFEANLNTPGSFDNATKGCTYAIHVASPFLHVSKHPQTEIINPAVNGTLSFLQSCKKASVRKVVLTCSAAAVASRGIPGKIFDESDWDIESSLTILPYYYSKKLAEESAWNFVKEQAPEMSLVVMNPVAVFGPSLTPNMSESVKIFKDCVDGLFPGAVDLELAYVDVRDVSEAHIRAMESETASGRYLLADSEKLLSVGEILKYAGEMGFKVPTLDLTNAFISSLVKLSSYISPGGQLGVYVRRHLGNPVVVTSEKAIKELNMSFRGKSEMCTDTLKNMIEMGVMEDPNGK